MKRSPSHQDQSPVPKKPYASPVLAVFGDVRRLTQGGTGKGNDSANGTTTMMAQCWIAEALYGKDDSRVTLIRAWLQRCHARHDRWALVVVPLYARFGERIASILQALPVLKGPFRPLFELALCHAHREYAVELLSRSHRDNGRYPSPAVP